ncbi:MAG: acyltransferase 3 [Frankiales bacterium]|nr:acyltransferase 3 [Frankiales bacterium]
MSLTTSLRYEPGPIRSRTAAATDGASPRLQALTGLRGAAISLVLVAHGHLPHMNVGLFGVDVFFVLSGFLITGLLQKLVSAPSLRAQRLRAYGYFMARRAVRLGPAFVVALAAIGCWSTLTGIARAPQCTALAASYTMDLPFFSARACAGPFHITWSLAAEEQFYLVWPLLVVGLAGLRSRRASLVCLAAYAACAVLVHGTYWLSHDTAGWLNYVPGGRSAALLLGAAVAYTLAGPGPTRFAALLGHAALPLVTAGFVVTAVLDGAEGGPPQALLGPLVAVPSAGLIYVLVVRRSHACLRLFSQRWLVWLGEISYSLYLVHILALYITRQLRHDDSVATNLLGMAAAVSVAALLHRLVEERARRWGYAKLAELEAAQDPRRQGQRAQ